MDSSSPHQDSNGNENMSEDSLASPYGYAAPYLDPHLSVQVNPHGIDPFSFPSMAPLEAKALSFEFRGAGGHNNSAVPTNVSRNVYAGVIKPTIAIVNRAKSNPYGANLDSSSSSTNLAVRLPDESQGLATLDENYTNAASPGARSQVRDAAILDGNHQMSVACNSYEVQQAKLALNQHISDRMSFVQNAGERLQAVVGVKNDLPFGLPDPQYPVIPNTLGQGNSQNVGSDSTPNDGPRRDSGIALQQQMFQNSNAATPSSIGPNGEGLRDWLIANGRRNGQNKRDCTSISFHDFTPDPQSGAFANVLLGHYTADGISERISVYETEVPKSYTDSQGVPHPSTETWLWFMIARPILSTNPRNAATHPSFGASNHDPSVTASIQNTYSPAPNFPSPIPRNYVVFALPAAHCTAYDERIDSAVPASTLLSGRNGLPWNSQGGSGAVASKIYKRKDYDLAQQGVPLFEFSSFTTEHPTFPPTGTPISFLSAEAVGPFFTTDTQAYLPALTPEQWHANCAHWAAQHDVSQKDAIANLEQKGLLRNFRARGEECPGPWEGRWWGVFYECVYEDKERWRAIMRAMGMGKLRIATRWTESAGKDIRPLGVWLDPKLREDAGGVMKRDAGLGVEGMGFGRGGGGLGRGRGKRGGPRFARGEGQA